MTARALLLAAAASPRHRPLSPRPRAAARARGRRASRPTTKPGARLHRLFHESDEANLRRNPISAMFRGDLRYADRLGDYISDAYYAAERAAAEAGSRRARARSTATRSTPTDRLAYDVFKYQREDDLADVQPDMLALTAVRPINHFSGFHTFYPVFASGRSAAPFRNVEDYDNNVRRHREFAGLIDRAIGRFRQGLASGVVETKLTIRNVIEQLDTQLRDAPEASPYYGPAQTFPDTVPEAERARLRAELLAVIRDDIFPAYRRLRDFLQNEYLPHARDGVGLVHMRGGDRLYARLIEENTTLPLTADEVHNLGLREVARIRGEMDAIRRQTELHRHARPVLRVSSAPTAASSRRAASALRDGYYAIGRRVDARIREFFSTIPRTPARDPRGRGLPRAQRGRRLLSGRHARRHRGPASSITTPTICPRGGPRAWRRSICTRARPATISRSASPHENEALPNFMRFGGNTAFVEGWALYAETLWDELGMETDPYQRFGGLNDEMLRAMRLVVDSGIHAKGWTRDQAIQYMLDNSGMSRTEVVAEVERYIAIPGQALAYKIGQLKILELRARAEAALGTRFDLRDFHAQVLMTGALPLPVLERKIDDWIASRRAG